MSSLSLPIRYAHSHLPHSLFFFACSIYVYICIVILDIASIHMSLYWLIRDRFFFCRKSRAKKVSCGHRVSSLHALSLSLFPALKE